MTPSTEISLLSASCSNVGHHGQQRAHNGGSDAKNLTPSVVPLLLGKTDFVERYREFLTTVALLPRIWATELGSTVKANKPADNASTTPLLLSWLCVNMNGFFYGTKQYPTPPHSSMVSWAQVHSTLKTLTTIASPFAHPICAPEGGR